ncbi:MAG: hypothetical protein MI717_09865 [Spirochaetales bacterium]|nr:hypothetical protein [Spirochaetales bacterium]
MVRETKDSYIANHQIYPVPQELQDRAQQFLPELHVAPESGAPISFDDYLQGAKLMRKKEVLAETVSAESLSQLSPEEECGTHLDNPEDVPSPEIAPYYVQVFEDQSPDLREENWIYLRYIPVFDWSGLAPKRSFLARIGVGLTGGKSERWHRLDVHTCAILGFNPEGEFKTLTLAQHNHQKTYIAGIDFPSEQAPQLVAAFQSNELYLDEGESEEVAHRVVPFFSGVDYLIDGKRKPALWAEDVTVGRNAGGLPVAMTLEFPFPNHPLLDFAGLLAPPKRILGLYVGRDGPPGSNYFAPPSFLSMPDFVAMGYWQEGDEELLNQLKPMLKGLRSDWEGMEDILRQRIREALAK